MFLQSRFFSNCFAFPFLTMILYNFLTKTIQNIYDLPAFWSAKQLQPSLQDKRMLFASQCVDSFPYHLHNRSSLMKTNSSQNSAKMLPMLSSHRRYPMQADSLFHCQLRYQRPSFRLCLQLANRQLRISVRMFFVIRHQSTSMQPTVFKLAMMLFYIYFCLVLDVINRICLQLKLKKFNLCAYHNFWLVKVINNC